MPPRTRIAGTLGPACDDRRTLDGMVRAGMRVARLNFSHGTPDEHRARVLRLRAVAAKLGVEVAILGDLQGPRFRVGRLPGGRRDLCDGQRVTLLAGRTAAEGDAVPVSYAALARETRSGQRVLLDDGKIALTVLSVRGREVRCRVDRGGTLTDYKGINLPGGALGVPALTAKDRADLRLAVEIGCDWLAVSFVRRAGHIRTARRLLDRLGSSMPVMAKIERPEAIDDLPAILEESDAVLVARGDLGVEFPPERVPVLQKAILEAALTAGKPAMTATQMLDSMRHAPRPTRAEVSDVANAVFDGSACLLLTGETAAGEYPVEAVATMTRIATEAERAGRVVEAPRPELPLGIPAATCAAASQCATDLGARYLAAYTVSGATAHAVAAFRPRTPILALTPERAVARRALMYWATEPIVTPRLTGTRALIRCLDHTLVERRLAVEGDVVVVVSGFPVGIPGTTNLIKVHRVGDADTPR